MRHLLFLLVLVVYGSNAQLRLPSILSSGMVLQQQDSVSVWGWAGPSEWVYVKGSWSERTDSARTSNYATWQLKIKTPKAGGPYTLTVRTRNAIIDLSDVWIGEVWICSGQSNMEWNYYHGLKDIRDELPTCHNPRIRFFNIPKTASDSRQDDVKAVWTVCDSVSLKSFSAVGYFFGKRLHENLDVPIGLINASWGGTPAEPWTPSEVIESDPVLQDAAQRLNEFAWWPKKPGAAFNAMIAPVTRFALRGAIWYQGESNTTTHATYTRLFTSMIGAWRKQWGREFPFYYVQIAPFAYGNHNIGALLQEAQTRSLGFSNTGMVVITDLVDNIEDIHPVNKHDVGYRLANLALAETYGKKMAAYRSPQYKSMQPVKGKLEVSFDYVPTSLEIRGKEPVGFEIAGEDGIWMPALVKADGKKLVIWNKKLKDPKHIRYGFGNTVIGNAFSKEGLPVCPFRTDSFPVKQDPVQ